MFASLLLWAASTAAAGQAASIAAPVDSRLHSSHASQIVWAFLAPKSSGLPAAGVADACQFAPHLSQRALARRALRRTLPAIADLRDAPVDPCQVEAIAATGAHVRTVSRWLNAVSLQVSDNQVAAIAALPFVRSIQPVAAARRNNVVPIIESTIADDEFIPRDGDAAWYGMSFNQLNQITVVSARNAGYTGLGVTIGILDTGFVRTHQAFNQGDPNHYLRLQAERDFINDDNNTANESGDPDSQHNHGTYILGTLAAYQPTRLVGAAYDATYLLAKTEDVAQEVPAEEDYYVEALEWFESLGADVATSSLSYSDWYTQSDYDGRTCVTTIAVNLATANGMVCCTAAGNAGHDANPATHHLGAPADAIDVFTCGATDWQGTIASFSSDGPTIDGRSKPEVLARGVSTRTVNPGDNSAISSPSGTSLSTPLIAGAAALVVQAHPDWTVAQVRRAILATARDFVTNGAPDPLFVRGHGLIDTWSAISYRHGDLNGDAVADADDIALFVNRYIVDSGNTPERRAIDFNVDGQIDNADVLIFVQDLLAS